MKLCPYCGYANREDATQCRRCDASFLRRPEPPMAPKSYWVGPAKAQTVRRYALALLTLGLLMKVCWAGYGPWPVIDYPPCAEMRHWLEPVLLYLGAAGYVCGWVLRFI